MTLRTVLVGNPNSGKTTLFNALTGARQKVGNWPGVTVERKEGVSEFQGQRCAIMDLPGIYTLTSHPDEGAIDTRIACEYILSGQVDVIINVIDACHLERNLYLTTQLLEIGLPTIVVLTMVDVAKKRGIQIDVDSLARQLNCTVVLLPAQQQQGIVALQQAIIAAQTPQQPFSLAYPANFCIAYTQLANLIAQQTSLQASSTCLSIRLLENDALLEQYFVTQPLIMAELQRIRHSLEDPDIMIADTRYSWAHRVAQAVTRLNPVKSQRTMTARLDQWVLHRTLGIPIFLSIIYTMFFIAINIGGALQGFFDILSDTLFVQGLAHLLQFWHSPEWLIAILASGVGKGINTTVTFIPVLACLFLCLAFLEDSGYMARAACVVDRLMRVMGLPGQAFVPLIVGFGCNVPAIMAARTLETRRDQILTVMMMPFMSCGARLAIYAIFTAAFFPHHGQNIVFVLYLLGIFMAIATAYLLRKTLLPGQHSPLILELPPYHLPPLGLVLRRSWQRLQSFIIRAGKLIIPLCLLIGALNAITWQGHLVTSLQQTSILASFGQTITPLFAPMGIHTDNWPATVGLITGILAKEVVIATLNTLYLQAAHLSTAPVVFNFWQGIQAAFASIPANFHWLSQGFNSIGAKQQVLSHAAYGQMVQRFDGVFGAMAYLLFILLYSPCISAIATIARELTVRWALFAILWTTGLAYMVAVLFYQIATVQVHPLQTVLWLSIFISCLYLVITGMRMQAKGMVYATV
jgi:ferrous iron transport protein B